MLSYKHGYHAGNQADVLKHICLIQAYKSLKKHHKSISYIDTHAGSGDYNFKSDYMSKNKIIVCATSVHKVIKIKRIINKVDFIFLNKAELLKLTNSSNIILGVKKILKQNKKIKIITTNSKNNVIFGSNEFIKKIKPPSIKVVNENGAGDALAAMMLYLFSINEKMNYILKTSVACGSYYASGKSLKTKSDFLKIKNLSKRVSVQ